MRTTMQNKLTQPEILAPAGDWERFEAALDFGADAVYLGGTRFGMRAASARFTPELLEKATRLAHQRGKRVYLTCNTLPRNQEIPLFEGFLEQAVACQVDALIVADLGLLALVRQYAPDMPIHMSTQTGIVNYAAANQLYQMGASRVVLARELSLDEIAEIRAKTPKELEIEAFVHGAMCMSFSGRCLLSSYLTNRDANRGACSQPCRWSYHLMEEKRPGQFFPVFEDEHGSYILNAKDLCMLPYLDKVVEAGVDSLKIEGRAKSSYYVSIVTNAYRQAMDLYLQDPARFQVPDWLLEEVYKVSHRQYCTGFFFGHPQDCQYYETGGYIRNYDVVACVDRWEDGRCYATQRNRFFAGDRVEILAPGQKPFALEITDLRDGEGTSIETANHAMMQLSFACPTQVPPHTIIRKAVSEV